MLLLTPLVRILSSTVDTAYHKHLLKRSNEHLLSTENISGSEELLEAVAKYVMYIGGKFFFSDSDINREPSQTRIRVQRLSLGGLHLHF